MSDLIERLEGLTGPCRECDGLIAASLSLPHGPKEIVDYESRCVHHIDEQAWRYTGSIDAAMTLVPDDWFWVLMMDGEGDGYQAAVSWIDTKHLAFSAGKLPAIALCIAALKATP